MFDLSNNAGRCLLPFPIYSTNAYLYLFQHPLSQELVAAVYSEFLCEGSVSLASPVPLEVADLFRVAVCGRGRVLPGKKALSLENHILGRRGLTKGQRTDMPHVKRIGSRERRMGSRSRH